MMSGMSAPESLEAIPNTGHHFLFVPFDEALNANDALQKSWAIQDEAPWKEWPTAKWLRYRPARRYVAETGEYLLGLWVAMESNTGDAARGIEIAPRSPVAERERTTNAPPYYSASPQYGTVELPKLQVQIAGETIGEFQLPTVIWKQPNADDFIDVDLVVDFGNTRTLALLLENDGSQSVSLADKCRPVRFLPRGTPHERMSTDVGGDSYSIVDSWVVLHETLFSNMEPGSENFSPVLEEHTEVGEEGVFVKRKREVVVAETKRMPQMFVELSPAILGGGVELDSARQILRDCNLSDDPNMFLSSPKRYIWDTDRVEHVGRSKWNAALNRWNQNLREPQYQLPELSGPIMLLMDSDGRMWDIDQESPPNEREDSAERPQLNDQPEHPRCDSMSWVALQVIETAYRQVNSKAHRASAHPYTPRRLRSVVVTHPSGWSGEEVERYKAQWQKAINIFTVGHLNDRRPISEGGERPELIMYLDEAVASQLPFVYSEMQRMPFGENWLELVGRGEGADSMARVMNIDIGGGTADWSVIDYQDKLPGLGVVLSSRVLFRDSNNTAGDQAVKEVIERVLLPYLGQQLAPEQRDRMDRLFRQAPHEWGDGIQKRVARIVRLVLIPIVTYWFRELVESEGNVNHSSRSVSEMLNSDGTAAIDLAIVNDLNALTLEHIGVELIPLQTPLAYDQQKLRECIKTTFEPLIISLSKVVAAFDCDLAIVSGKPTELPVLNDLILQHLPLMPCRILFSRGFDVGDWYPVGADRGRITDAKSATVVGAVLVRAMDHNLMEVPWSLDQKDDLVAGTQVYWGPYASGQPFDEGVYLEPGKEQVKVKALLGTKIAKKKHLSPYVNPDLQYRLRWRPGKERNQASPLLEVKLRRVSCGEYPEILELVDVQGECNGQPVTIDDIELSLCTLNEGEFWMDSPRFHIHW